MGNNKSHKWRMLNARNAARFKVTSAGATPGEFSSIKVGRGPGGAKPENDPARITRRR